MHSVLATNVNENKAYTFWSTIALIVALLAAFAGFTMSHAWFTAEMPAERIVPLYITPLSKTVYGEQFSRGYPSIVVSLDEFRKQSAGKSYIVSYSRDLDAGTADMSNRKTYISYSMRMTDLDLYIAAYQYPPVFNVPVYEQRTLYDPQRRAFFSSVTGVSYLLIGWGVIFMVIGAAVAAFCAFLLYDLTLPKYERKFR